MKTGLFFGSFNPIHVGHLIIANFMATQTDLKEVWLVVTPQNPLKSKKSLARDWDRLQLVHLAVKDNDHLRPCDIEFNLPKPSYTIDTLAHLIEKYPNRTFVPIMGGDNLMTLYKWKNYEKLLKYYQIYVYQRPTYELGELQHHPSIHIFEAPLMQISASYIRKCIQQKHSIEYLVTEEVRQYIEEVGLYQ